MPVTVIQALETDIFAGASIVAGAKGLSNPIRWVHVCERVDSGQYLSGNELVLTTGGSLYTRKQQVEYIQGLALAKIAALVIFLGDSLPKVPGYWRELADEWSIPLVIAPPNKTFITISEEIGKMLHAEALEEAKRRQPRPEMAVANKIMGFFQDVITEEIAGRGGLELAADRLGLPTGGMYAVVIYRLARELAQDDVFEAIENTMETLSRSSLMGWCIPAEFWHGRLTMVLSTADGDTPAQLKDAATLLHSRLEAKSPSLKIDYIGIGRPYPVDELPKSYREAKLASEAGHSRIGGKGTKLQYFGDLGLYRLLYGVEDKRELVSFYRESVSKLVEYDRTYKHELLKTLEVYFRHEGNLRETSEALFIHRHTLRYRLQRVEELTGLSLNRFEDRLTLLLGLMVWQMLRGEREIFSYPNV